MTEKLLGEIRELSDGREVRLMEVCGTHTMAIFRHGIRSLLPETVKLLSGPGCPVCVTSIRDMDMAIELSRTEGVVLATFGDMIRVPGSMGSLASARAEGASVRVVYSPLDALDMARENPGKNIVFFAAGFETTSPSVAATLEKADMDGTKNFSVFSVHKVIPPALRVLLDSPEVNIDGFLLPGHVSTIIGAAPYGFLSKQYKTPSVIAGFEANDILLSIAMLLKQIRNQTPSVEIQYSRVVRPEGNPHAVGMLEKYFEPAPARWRGIGELPESGLSLRDKYSRRDAVKIFGIDAPEGKEPPGCKCGEVLRGLMLPGDCPLFGRRCVPENPVGACMVSSEGSCSIYYRYSEGVG